VCHARVAGSRFRCTITARDRATPCRSSGRTAPSCGRARSSTSRGPCGNGPSRQHMASLRPSVLVAFTRLRLSPKATPSPTTMSRSLSSKPSAPSNGDNQSAARSRTSQWIHNVERHDTRSNMGDRPSLDRSFGQVCGVDNAFVGHRCMKSPLRSGRFNRVRRTLARAFRHDRKVSRLSLILCRSPRRLKLPKRYGRRRFPKIAFL
jgi:hypothetical protein